MCRHKSEKTLEQERERRCRRELRERRRQEREEKRQLRLEKQRRREEVKSYKLPLEGAQGSTPGYFCFQAFECSMNLAKQGKESWVKEKA